ncbi:Ribosomal RNA small subunit methyltransferase G [Roseimaritima multifibrata]|uniref:Ribosomal RNA small subunit methyltransferase G n=1 Tax=Roseimaritima multifibrata TaxID=1930274 RepID=A0A517MJQ8_9BACT|nr:16S rRNA (guanine(527)-N(7))-methyltransferase RsmG [Roseimaritima multifibrata]QDS95017.1 Ribosomal RNA small subunit methyltransferase G [Roseimaritima multifibrata]
MPIDAEFQAALERAGYELPEPMAEKIEAYVRVLWDWNERLNLTRHTDWQTFVERDLRDVLQLVPLIEPNEEVLDLGSGGGVPGIPLAILRPDIQVSLAESVGKRATVLNTFVEELDLPVPVYAARGEDILEDFRFETIVVRAVGSMLKICNWIAPHWPSVGRILMIKGPKWVEERGEARHFGAMEQLDLRKLATYPLGDGENEGVILQVMPAARIRE